MAMFSKRHYEALATMMQELRETYIGGAITFEELTTRSADLLAQDNPAFDRGRFERACQPGANVRARSK